MGKLSRAVEVALSSKFIASCKASAFSWKHDSSDKMTPAECALKLVLTATQSHYEFRGVIDDKRLEHLLLVGKQILYKSHQESDVRYVIIVDYRC